MHRALAFALVALLVLAGPVAGRAWQYPDAPGVAPVFHETPTSTPRETTPPVEQVTSSRPGCRPYPTSANSPTGIVGCQLAGPTVGIAS